MRITPDGDLPVGGEIVKKRRRSVPCRIGRPEHRSRRTALLSGNVARNGNVRRRNACLEASLLEGVTSSLRTLPESLSDVRREIVALSGDLLPAFGRCPSSAVGSRGPARFLRTLSRCGPGVFADKFFSSVSGDMLRSFLILFWAGLFRVMIYPPTGVPIYI